MFVCNKCLEKKATFTDMAGKYEWCDVCVPRGCSCNDESVHYYPNNGEEEDIEELKFQVNSFKNEVLNGNYYLTDYGKREHCSGKHINVIKDKVEIKKVLNDFSDEQILGLEATPLDDNDREYPCVEIEHKRDFSVLKVDEIIFSLKWNDFYIIKEEYKDSFKAYPILNEIPLCEYHSFDENKLEELDVDYSNAIYINKNGVNYNDSEIDLYLSVLDVFGYKNSSLYDFLQTFIYCNKDFKSFVDSNYDYNENIAFFFGALEEDLTYNKKYSESSLKNKKIVEDYLFSYFKYENDESYRRTDLRELSQKEVKQLMKYLYLFHYYNEEVKYSDIYNSTVIVGCDCGCGGDMLDDYEYEYIGNLSSKREKVFKKIINLIY